MENFDRGESDYPLTSGTDLKESSMKEAKDEFDKTLNDIASAEGITFDSSDKDATGSAKSLIEMEVKVVENTSTNEKEITNAVLQDSEDLQAKVTTVVRNNFSNGSNKIERNPIALPKICEQQRTKLSVHPNNDTILSSIKEVRKDSSTDVHKGGPTKRQKQLHQRRSESFYGVYKGFTLTQYKFHNNQIPRTSRHDSLMYNINTNNTSPNTLNDSQNQTVNTSANTSNDRQNLSIDASPNTSNNDQNQSNVTVNVPQSKETVQSKTSRENK